MHPEAAPPAPVHLPSRRRLMMQHLERHAEYDQGQEAAVEHYIDNDHSLQGESADDHDHQMLTGRSLLRSKYGLPPQISKTAYDDHALETYTNDDHLQKQEATAADLYQKRGSRNLSALRAKYGLSNHSSRPYSDHEYGLEQYTDDDHFLEQELAAAEHACLRAATQSHRAYNSHPHGKYAEHYTVDHELMQQDFKADHKGSRNVAAATLQAAQAQATELRALHSAMLNNYGFADRNIAANNDYHHKQKQQEHALLHNSKPKKASSKKSKVYSDADDRGEEMQNPVSGTSSASSTADCFIRPAHEYPIFMPSHEDMNTMDRRSSVDNCEALMREERLNYIFDHDNKRSFSGMQIYGKHSKRDSNSASCLHESLNLPPRSASSLTAHFRDKTDDHPLHHMSLNLPGGSQHRLFNTAAKYKQNPLFDQYDHANALDGLSDSSSMKRVHDSSLHVSAARSGPMDQYAHEGKAAFTGRQRALLEFLSEEPARMRAFNELAAMSKPPQNDKPVRTRRDAAPPADHNLTTSKRIKGKLYESNQSVDCLPSSSDHHLHQYQSMPHFSHISTAPRVDEKLAHTPTNDHSDQGVNGGGVSFDKCRPTAGVHTVVLPLTDSRDLSADHRPANVANAGTAAPSKEKPDQKKPSLKGWFFRGKKKHNLNNADSLNGQTNPAAISASQDRIPIASVSGSTTQEKQLSNSSPTVLKDKHSSASTTSTSTAAAQSSHVFSSLINSEAEKELEVAMAMDLMELKVLQANTKRDAAMAEVLELRLTMDSMAKKLVEVERHCEALKTQLIDARAVVLHHEDDQILADHRNSTPAAEIISNADGLNVNSDDTGAAAEIADADETDHYESDSIDHREERRPSNGISKIRPGLSSGYGSRGGSSGRCVQPTKADFLNAVAEARVGIRQVSRVLLQHIQESKGSGMLLQVQADNEKLAGGGREEEAAGLKNEQGEQATKGREREIWGPILIMCREATKGDEKDGMSGGGGGGGRGRRVAYCVEALISIAFHEHFENVGFDKNGAHKILDPSQRALAFYHSFLKLAKLTPNQLLTQPSPLYNSAFDHFCSRKMRTLGRALGCPGRLWPDELARTFLSAARAVWLLHHLAFAYHGRPPGIFRVASQSSFDARFMEVLPSDYRHVSPSSHLLVSLMVMPGFFLPDDIIKCKVWAS